MKFSLGADPEIFLQDATNAFVSAIGLIGGTKQMPRPLPIGNGFAVQEDNVAVEYNIPPSHSIDDFDKNIASAMEFIKAEVQKHGLHFAKESAVSFPVEQLMHPQALEFGCDPDFNAWKDGARNPRPKAADKALRTCGGHVHIGYNFKSEDDVINFVKHLDLFFIPACLMDTGELRKELYGKAGAFRFKPYGCEYRSLSNFWIFDSAYRKWVWGAVDNAMNAWQNNSIDIDAERKPILAAINNNNKRAAQFLIEKYQLQVV